MAEPWRQGSLLGFDLETTGVDRFVDVPVSYAFVAFEHGHVRESLSKIVNPGRPIPPGAMAVHGITDERAVSEGQPLGEAIKEIVARLVQASTDGETVVGANVVYDLTMVDATARRELGLGLRDAGFDASIIDVLVIDKTYAKWRKGKRTLDLLCGYHGVELDGAHDAFVDARASVEVALSQPDVYRSNPRLWASKDLPDLDALSARELTDLQIGWHRAWAEDFSQWRQSKGSPPLAPDELLWPIAQRA